MKLPTAELRGITIKINHGSKMKTWEPMPPVFCAREQVYKDFKGWEWEYSKKRPLYILRLLVRY